MYKHSLCLNNVQKKSACQASTCICVTLPLKTFFFSRARAGGFYEFFFSFSFLCDEKKKENKRGLQVRGQPPKKKNQGKKRPVCDGPASQTSK